MKESVLAMVRRHPFVAEIEPRHVEKLATLAKETRFERDQILFREGDECSEFYLIVTGRIALEIAALGHTSRGRRRAVAGDATAASRYVLSDSRSGRSVTGQRDRRRELGIRGAELS